MVFTDVYCGCIVLAKLIFCHSFYTATKLPIDISVKGISIMFTTNIFSFIINLSSSVNVISSTATIFTFPSISVAALPLFLLFCQHHQQQSLLSFCQCQQQHCYTIIILSTYLAELSQLLSFCQHIQQNCHYYYHCQQHFKHCRYFYHSVNCLTELSLLLSLC